MKKRTFDLICFITLLILIGIFFYAVYYVTIREEPKPERNYFIDNQE